MAEAFYVTTAIDYANAAPHIGHAYEKVAADAVARYERLRGRDVFFLTGLDEHGLKIERAAGAQGVEPQSFVDALAPQFEAAWRELGVAYDGFLRTSAPRHVAAVQYAFERLLANGDIQLATYEGLYCVGCEEFKNERDLVEGLCPQHGTVPQSYREDNYVLAVSRYRERIRAHIEQHPAFIAPLSRRHEILNLLETFPDVSISRQNLKWGIPVPGDDKQVIYVWLDALLNYLTGIGWPDDMARFERYWPADLQLIGKDITKFHCIIWPAILMALDLPLPRTIYGHGWLNVGDQKMSKSLGNVIEPAAFAREYGADALRYYMLREITFGRDGSYTFEAFKFRVNADLANNLGNALNRTLGILGKHFAGEVPADQPLVTVELSRRVAVTVAEVEDLMGGAEPYRIQETLQATWGLIDAINKYIDQQAPWALAKAGEMNALGGVLYGVLEALRVVAILVSPFIPHLASRIWEQLGVALPLDAQRWADLTWGGLKTGTQTHPGGPIYPRIEDALAGTTGGKKKSRAGVD